ncbi:MAG: YfhO family protein [Porcipelethomonas sp.]
MENKKTLSAKRSIRNILFYNSKGETRLFLFLSFLLPFLIIWGIFIYFQVHPFGDKQILVTDLWHQYYPFFQEEQDKLQNMSSLFYSWNTGLGTNFLSIMSYYAASPLNLLSVFFPIEASRDVMTFLLTVKIGCAGLFFAVFLKNVFGRNDFTIVGFSLFYAFCDYIMGYYWNLIWIDTVALLPLVVLGTIKLVKEGKYKLYAISLALSLVSNFYIGLFTCIFTVMVFVAAVIINWKGFKNAFVRLGQISGATVLGIGMGAVMLLPAYLALQLTNSVDNTFPAFIEFYESWLTMISNAVGFHEPTAKEGLPNLYCGMFAIILLGIFIVNKKIKIREKIITVLYLAFIIVSCNMNILNYIWHGFHFTNMIPYRFSFLFSFILAAAAYRAFTVITEDINIFDILTMSAMTCVIALVSYTCQEERAVVLSVITCFVYIAVMFIYERKLINKKVMGIAVAVVCTAEMGINAYIGVKTVTTTTYSVYPDKVGRVRQLIDMEADNESDFFRTELTQTYTINDPALYTFKGVSQFSSTANVNVTRFLEGLGIQASAAGNRYYYTQSTPIVNSFLNIRYLVAKDGYTGDATFLDEAASIDELKLYENNAYLPLAFVADSSIMDYTGEGETQADNQNELFRLASGISGDVLNRINVKDVGHKGLNVVKSTEGNYSYQYNKPSDGSDECYIKYNYLIEEDGPVYAVVNFDNSKGFKARTEGSLGHTFPSQNYKTITAVGNYKAGDVMTIQANVDKEKSGTGRMFVYSIDEELFRQGIEKLSAGGLEISFYDDTSINGTFTAENDGVLYTSIPYDGGWTAYIDGEEAEITPLKDALVCIPVTKGQHEITLKYCPPGFTAGAIISVCSIIALAAVWMLEKKYRIKAAVNIKSTAAAGGDALTESGGHDTSLPETLNADTAQTDSPEEENIPAAENTEEDSGADQKDA